MNERLEEPSTKPASLAMERPVWRDLWEGFQAPFVGAAILWREPRLRPYAIVPTLLGLAWGMLAVLELFVPGGEGSAWWSQALGWLAHALLALAVLWIQILIALLAPLLDWLGERTEVWLGALPEGPPFWRELLSPAFWRRTLAAIWEAIKLLAFKVVVLVAGSLVGLIPILGPVVATAASGLVTGIDFLDYPLARRGWPLNRKLRWAAAQWPVTLGFAAASGTLLAVPGIGGIMLAPCVVGGTRLVLARLSSSELSAR